MLSVSVYVVIFTIIAYLVAYLKRKNKVEDYNYWSIILTIFFGRVFPYLMLEDKSKVVYLGFAIELIMYIYLFLVENDFDTKKVSAPFMWALAQPASILAILCGSQRGIIVSIGGVFVIMHIRFFLRYMDRKNKGNGDAEDVVNKKEESDASQIKVEAKKNSKAEKKRIYKAQKQEASVKETLTKIDIIALAGITLIYAAFIFHDIGSKHVPVTEHHMAIADGTNEITLDLGSEQYVSKIWVWLGNENAKCAYSWYSFDESKWIVMADDYELTGVFKWRSFSADQNMQHIGLVFQTEPVIINEVVVQGADGSIITPANAGNYPELFDEQDLFTDNPTYFDETMFDEVYHARTAYEFIYDYNIYEYTHPPLGKILISFGIRMFGMTPFGWRFVTGIFGVLLIPLTFAFAYALTGRRKESFLTSILMCVGFMNYTLSRIGTIDIIVALFAMMMFYFMLLYVKNLNIAVISKKQLIRLALCGLSTGLAIATKWTGIYAAAGIAIMFFYGLFKHYRDSSQRKGMVNELARLFGFCVAVFVVIPVVIYSLSYIEFVQVDPSKSLAKTVIDNAVGMLSYHNGIKQSHPYASEWYQWLINYRPLLDACNFVGDKTKTVSTFINPLVCFGGLIAVIHNIYLWRVKRDDRSGMLVIAYFAMMLPWLLVHRTVFIYQYFVSMLVMIFMIGYSFSSFSKKHKNAWQVMAVFVVIAICLFGYFYPVISGNPVSYDFVNNHLEWIESWIFA